MLCVCERETQVKAQRKQSCIHQLLLLISRFIGLINVELNRTPVETIGEISLYHTPALSLLLTVSLPLPFSFSLRGHNGTNFLEEKLCFSLCGKYELHTGSVGHYSESWRKIMVTNSKTPAEKPL